MLIARDLIRRFAPPSPEEKGEIIGGGARPHPTPLEKVPEGRMRSLAKGSESRIGAVIF